MDIEIKTWLYDILNPINEIDSFFDEQSKEFDIYKNDIRTKRAVERNIKLLVKQPVEFYKNTILSACQIQERLLIPGIE